MLDELRSKIQEIDNELVTLICRRQVLVQEIKTIKKSLMVPIRNKELENKKLLAVREIADSFCVDSQLAVDILRLLILHSVADQCDD